MRFATSFLLMRSQPVNPQYWSLLSDDDKDVYLRIKAALSAPSLRNKRNTRMESFHGILEAIEVFENSDAANKWRRCLVCGMCRFRDWTGIAVNTTQLKRLIFRCKSSINGSLKGLGYGQITNNTGINHNSVARDSLSWRQPSGAQEMDNPFEGCHHPEHPGC